MSEKRKPDVKIVACVRGKEVRIELFRAYLWPKKFTRQSDHLKWRVRMHGKWANGDTVYTMSEVVRQMRGWISKRLKK
jgi:hypothetical protein